jgi:hypothetical protein
VIFPENFKKHKIFSKIALNSQLEDENTAQEIHEWRIHSQCCFPKDGQQPISHSCIYFSYAWKSLLDFPNVWFWLSVTKRILINEKIIAGMILVWPRGHPDCHLSSLVVCDSPLCFMNSSGSLFPITQKLPGLGNLQGSKWCASPGTFLLCKVVNHILLSVQKGYSTSFAFRQTWVQVLVCFNSCVTWSKICKLLEPQFLSVNMG